MALAFEVVDDQLQQTLAKTCSLFLGEQGQDHDLTRVGGPEAVADKLAASPCHPARQSAGPCIFGPRLSGYAVSAKSPFRDGVLARHATYDNALSYICCNGACDLEFDGGHGTRVLAHS